MDNQTAVRNESLQLRLYPCNFCDAAADKYQVPTNLSQKGPAARRNTIANPGLFGDERVGDAAGNKEEILIGNLPPCAGKNVLPATRWDFPGMIGLAATALVAAPPMLGASRWVQAFDSQLLCKVLFQLFQASIVAHRRSPRFQSRRRILAAACAELSGTGPVGF
jgi:hypothetical protein